MGKADALYLLYLVSACFTRYVHQNHLRSFSKLTCLAYTFANLILPPILISRSRVGPKHAQDENAPQMILMCISDYKSLLQTNPVQANTQLNFTGIKMRVGRGRQMKN